MFSKQLLLFFLACNFFAFSCKAQMDTTHVELWGAPKGYSEFSYMQYLNRKKVTPCMVDLKKFGYKEAYVAGVENLRLVLLRASPIYSFSPPVKKQKIYPPKKVIDLMYFGIDNEEVNFVKQDYFEFVYKDSVAIDNNIKMYQQYGVHLKKDKLYEKFDLIGSLDSTDKDSCLHFLKLSCEPRLKSAALLGYVSQSKSKADMLELFPFVLDFAVGDEANSYLNSYFYHNKLTAADWQRYHTMFISILNCQDPFRAASLMELYQKENYCRLFAKQILHTGNITIIEILKSRRKELSDLRQKTAKFLTYLTNEQFGNDYNAWLKYINQGT